MPRSRTARMVLTVSALIIPALLFSILHGGMNNNARIETADVVPQAYFTYEVDGGTISFTDQSRGFNLASWSWAFGDETHSSLQSPTHSYSQTGNYTVRLVVTDSAGRTSSWSEVVWVSSVEAAPLPVWIIPLLLMVMALAGAFFLSSVVGKIMSVVLLFGSLLWFASSGVLAAVASIIEVLL